jgi:hypothetical protein
MRKTLVKPLVAPALAAGLLLATSAAVLLATSLNAFSQETTGSIPTTALDEYMAAEDPPTFDDPDAAVEAFKTAVTAGDVEGLAKLLGLDGAKLKAAEGTADTFKQIQEATAEQVLVAEADDQQIIQLGKKLWPMPFPLVKGDDGKWAFDTVAGIDEIVDRRVGENEEEAIETARAYVEAQEDYLAEDRDDDGVKEYAQKLISSPGATDGLYWPSDEVRGESPAGEFVDLEQTANVQADRGYFGYRFKILTGQGDNVLGGAYDYRLNDNMVVGHALVAWPVTYAETGVKTFIINKDGVVYEADLGADTATLAPEITTFNPDDKWEVVKDE